MRVALAHDYLTQRGGGERVTLALTRAFPRAPLYTSVYAPDQTFPDFRAADVRTSCLQRLPHVRRDPRLALPFLAGTWDRMGVEDADVVVASSSGWAHGLPAPPGARKIVYCHNPARWLYQTDEYVSKGYRRFALSALKRSLLEWDQRAARSADVYLANSSAVAERIQRFYGIAAEVLHPPVSIDVSGDREAVPGLAPGFWLTVARGRSYKNVGAVVAGVEALNDGQLAVVGPTPAGVGCSPRTHWLGVVSDAQLRWLYANARALISVSHEDFGLTPLEANSFGTPVAVLRAGGFLDSLAEGTSGVWVEQPTAGAVRDALSTFPVLDRDPVRLHARAFDQSAFARRLQQIITRTWRPSSPHPAAHVSHLAEHSQDRGSDHRRPLGSDGEALGRVPEPVLSRGGSAHRRPLEPRPPLRTPSSRVG